MTARLHNAWLVRGGAAGHQTRTGDFWVYYRDADHVSSLYGSPMPYNQFFSGGEAFHGSTTMVDPFTGHRHGCINVYVEDAAQLWTSTSRVPGGGARTRSLIMTGDLSQHPLTARRERLIGPGWSR